MKKRHSAEKTGCWNLRKNALGKGKTEFLLIRGKEGGTKPITRKETGDLLVLDRRRSAFLQPKGLAISVWIGCRGGNQITKTGARRNTLITEDGSRERRKHPSSPKECGKGWIAKPAVGTLQEKREVNAEKRWTSRQRKRDNGGQGEDNGTTVKKRCVKIGAARKGYSKSNLPNSYTKGILGQKELGGKKKKRGLSLIAGERKANGTRWNRRGGKKGERPTH